MPLGHFLGAASPLSSRTAETIAWKSAPVGEKETLPFHSGSARSRMLLGRSFSAICSLLYISTVERAAKPVQAPLAGRYCSGIRARVSSPTGPKDRKSAGAGKGVVVREDS